MTNRQDEILNEILKLKSWLYGQNGFEGDIPQIKRAIANQSKRVRILEIALAGLLVSGGGAIGIIQLLN